MKHASKPGTLPIRQLVVAAALLVLTFPIAMASEPDNDVHSFVLDTQSEANVESPECLDFAALQEPAVLIGRLSNDMQRCLLENPAAQTTLDEHIERHIAQANCADPAVCFAIAMYLSRKGHTRAEEVIKWADEALDYRTIWNDETYNTRVNALLKVRALAASEAWIQAEMQNAIESSDQSHTAIEQTRGRTQTFARQWYVFADTVHAETAQPMGLCVSAAGSPEYCEETFLPPGTRFK
ncbi:MAG: hypothetical protein ACI8RZ_002977 [Myxococcota bacterium]|jgi:hypothetical protein